VTTTLTGCSHARPRRAAELTRSSGGAGGPGHRSQPVTSCPRDANLSVGMRQRSPSSVRRITTDSLLTLVCLALLAGCGSGSSAFATGALVSSRETASLRTCITTQLRIRPVNSFCRAR
jgi:hypothetical protein